jgi:rhodanese-related sulfurtransferase
MNGYSTDNQIVVVCRSGWRSRRAVQILRAKGYSHTKMLEGGMLAWEKAGLAEKVEQ